MDDSVLTAPCFGRLPSVRLMRGDAAGMRCLVSTRLRKRTAVSGLCSNAMWRNTLRQHWANVWRRWPSVDPTYFLSGYRTRLPLRRCVICQPVSDAVIQRVYPVVTYYLSTMIHLPSPLVLLSFETWVTDQGVTRGFTLSSKMLSTFATNRHNYNYKPI